MLHHMVCGMWQSVELRLDVYHVEKCNVRSNTPVSTLCQYIVGHVTSIKTAMAHVVLILRK